MKNGICVVSGEPDAIYWLVYQLSFHTGVTEENFKSIKKVDLKKFDWVIFDVAGHRLTQSQVEMKVGGKWVSGRSIVRMDLATALVSSIAGMQLLHTGARASEFLEIIAGVRA